VTSQDETFIPFSPGKMGLALAAALGFAIMGVWMLSLNQADMERMHRDDLIYTRIVAVVTIALAAPALVIGVRRYFDRSSGVRFDANGVGFVTCGASGPIVAWPDVLGARTFLASGHKFLVIEFRDPERYLAQLPFARRMLARSTLRMCGSPVAISTHVLKISFGELEAAFARYLRRYGRATSAA
jgi:hypothetical protein